MRIEYIAHINRTGYGKAAIGYIQRLAELGHDVRIQPIGDVHFSDDVQKVILEPMIARNIGKPEVRIIHTIPTAMYALEFVKPDDVYTIWFYAWEISSLSPSYMDCFQRVDHCVTFARWQVEVYKRDMQRDNISYIPHVSPIAFPAIKTNKNKDLFTFFTMCRWDERKDPLTLLKAYCHEFSMLDNVRLVVKTSDVVKEVTDRAMNNVMQLLRLNKQYPRIEIISKHLTEEEMNKRYLEADVFVSSTRGEGWGFGFNEALLQGIPCIYPDTQYIVKSFFTPENSVSVPTYDALVYNSAFPQITNKMVWAQTNDVALAKTMRNVYENYDSMFTLPVKISPKYIQEQEELNGMLDDILKLATRRV